jgi:DnaK suppressor protein
MANQNENTVRYGDKDLELFKTIILEKLSKAYASLSTLMGSLKGSSNEAISSVKDYEDGVAISEQQELGGLAERQRTLINHLEAALIRISLGTYGICKKTKKLISKERLLVVPHTEYSVEAKLPAKLKCTKSINNKRKIERTYVS